MKLNLEIQGGFSNISSQCELTGSEIPQDIYARVSQAIEEGLLQPEVNVALGSQFRDDCRYQLTVQDELSSPGITQLRFHESQVSTAALELIDDIRMLGLAKQRSKQ
ncbi:MAG: protealysin inhibitor emfourin [Oceanococcus sp.]